MKPSDPSGADRARTGLPPLVWALGFVSLLADVSSELVHPLLPLFVVGTLGAPATVLGLIEGSADALASLAKGWAGLRSDRSRRRLPYVRWGYALPMLGKAVISLATTWPVVYSGRLLDRLGKGLRTAPRDALLADAAPSGQRGAAFGLHRALDHCGALLGSAAAVALLALGWPLARIFVLAAVVGLAAWLMTLRLREPDVPARVAADVKSERLPPAYWRALALLSVPALGQCGVAFVLLRMVNLGWPAWQVVSAYACVYAIAALTSTPFGRFCDARGRRAALGLGWTMFALADLGLARPDLAGPWLPLALYGAAVGASEGAARAWLADFSPHARRGAGLGVSAALIGVAQLAGGLGAGLLWDFGSPAHPFYVAAAASLAASALLLCFRGARFSVTPS